MNKGNEAQALPLCNDTPFEQVVESIQARFITITTEEKSDMRLIQNI